jgi:sodium/hydrogen antiporter
MLGSVRHHRVCGRALERIAAVAVMLLVGTLLSLDAIPPEALWFVPLLLLAIRPLAVNLGMIGSAITPVQRAFISWFGIRGIGSIYYLMYAIVHGVPERLASWLTGMILAVVTTSVVVHGISVTPFMRHYDRTSD